MFEFLKNSRFIHYIQLKNRGLFRQKIKVFFLKKIKVFFFANRPLQGFNPSTRVYWKIRATLQVFSGFKGAQTTSALQTKRPPIGPESCWGSAVSHGLPSADTSMLSAASKVPKRDRLCRGSAVSHGLPSANTSPLSRFLAGSKVPKRHRLCRPNGHPLGLNSAGAVLFRMGCPAPIPLHSPGF